jgi:uncharacterized protein (DUF58 family)
MKFRKKTRVRFRIRAMGWIFLISFFLLLLAAWNTGANLLYVITGGLGSFVIVSYLLTGRGLKRLAVSREGPDAAHRCEKFAVTLRIENRSWLVPIFALRVERAEAPGKSAAHVMRIPARRAAVVRMTERFEKRGVHRLPEIVLATAFPFGLFERRRRVSDDVEVVIYPRVIPVRAGLLEQLPGSSQSPTVVRGDGDDFFSLREYVPGDDVRRIAWRASAKRGSLLIREMAQEASRYVVFVLDTAAPEDRAGFEDRFEEVVEMVASMCAALLAKQYTIAIVTPTLNLVGGEGKTQEKRALEMLARVAPDDGVPTGFGWFSFGEESGHASHAFATSDPNEWGRKGPRMGTRILDPREAILA